jgi:hypothetical protein
MIDQKKKQGGSGQDMAAYVCRKEAEYDKEEAGIAYKQNIKPKLSSEVENIRKL